MKKAAFFGLLVLLLLVALFVVARRQAVGEPLAEVDGVPVTVTEIEKAIGPPLAKLQEQIYNLRRQKLEEVINDRLLTREAAKRRISIPALLDAEVTSKVTLVTEQEVETFYEANKTRFPGDPAAAQQQIRTNLQNQKLAAKRQEFLQLLRSRAKIAVHLEPPPVYRVEVSTDGSPFKGPIKRR